MVDLMKSACGIDYAAAAPLADLAFLSRLLESRGETGRLSEAPSLRRIVQARGSLNHIRHSREKLALV